MSNFCFCAGGNLSLRVATCFNYKVPAFSSVLENVEQLLEAYVAYVVRVMWPACHSQDSLQLTCLCVHEQKLLAIYAVTVILPLTCITVIISL
jgi:hypothetical protein